MHGPHLKNEDSLAIAPVALSHPPEVGITLPAKLHGLSSFTLFASWRCLLLEV